MLTHHIVVDRYRCPEQFTGSDSCYGEPIFSAGPAREHHQTDGKDYHHYKPVVPEYVLELYSDSIRESGLSRSDSALDRLVEWLRREGYVGLSNGHTDDRARANRWLKDLYYSARPFLPKSVRTGLQRLYLSGWDKITFPSWPLDCSADGLIEGALADCIAAAGVDAVPFVWFWPYGASGAAIVTHDVETTSGREFCSNLMAIDESLGIQTSYQVVPEKRYDVPATFLEEIRVRGHEVNIQDLNHDGKLFRDRNEFLLRVKKINEYGRRFGAQGFRSAILYRNVDWYDALEFEYDMSVPCVGHLEAQRGGCCTVFPYFIGNILELPVTMTQDYSLFHILRDYTIDVWKEQSARIMEKHGLLSVIAHPDYLIEQRARSAYQGLLEHLCQLRAERGLWIAKPGDVNRWWRQRSNMTLVLEDGRWRIEGPGKEQAVVAFARLDGDQIVYVHDAGVVECREAHP